MQQASEMAQRMKRLSLTRARARTVHLSWFSGTSPWINIAQVKFTTKKRRLVNTEPRYNRTLERWWGEKWSLNQTILGSFCTTLLSHQAREPPSMPSALLAMKIRHSSKFQWLY